MKLKTSDEQLVVVERENFDSKALLQKYIPQINTISNDMGELNTSMYKFEMAQADSIAAVNKEVSRIGLELNSRLNDQVWKDKL